MTQAAELCRVLGDEARLRILRLVASEPLNVTELTGILGIAQSGVSRHLRLLKEAELVREEREGGFSYYHAVVDRAGAHRSIWSWLREQFRTGADDPALRADEARLQEVLRLRRENFETHGTEARQLVPGRSWAAWARAMGHLLPPLRVADLGCGEGYLTLEAARWAEYVIAIDKSAVVLKRARAFARRRGVTNVTWKRGEIERVPMATGSADVAILSQALHHASDPALAVAEAARIVVPRGRVVVLELRAHDQAWVRKRLGDKWLGFEDGRLVRLLRGAGLRNVKLQVGARRTGDPFTVLIASGVKTDDN